MGFHFAWAIRPPCGLNADDGWGRLQFQEEYYPDSGRKSRGERKARKESQAKRNKAR
jgi:hypothetical protein